MSAKDELIDYIVAKSDGRFVEETVEVMIAEAQIEAVGNFKNRLCSVFVNTMGLDFQGKVGYAFIQALEQADAELRKAAGKGE